MLKVVFWALPLVPSKHHLILSLNLVLLLISSSTFINSMISAEEFD